MSYPWRPHLAIQRTQRNHSPSSKFQKPQDTPRGPVSMSRYVRAGLEAQGGSAQAGGFNVVTDW